MKKDQSLPKNPVTGVADSNIIQLIHMLCSFVEAHQSTSVVPMRPISKPLALLFGKEDK